MYNSKFCDVCYDESNNVVFVKWKKFCCGEDYQAPLRYAIDLMEKHDNCHYVADTRDGFENDPEDTKWVFERFIPQAYAAGCRYIFFIIDQNNSLKEELEGQSVELSRYFTVKACYSMDEVSEILRHD
ncbi:MAG: hypothetical protein FWG24_03995 [Eggerthellaceae bacterium]|nr:hypothetical protein [Eggerthellaceae bacterium]